MHIYLNCTKPKDDNDLVICEKCGTKHKIEYDGIKAPYKETGIEYCKDCGVQLLKWNSTREPYLVKTE